MKDQNQPSSNIGADHNNDLLFQSITKELCARGWDASSNAGIVTVRTAVPETTVQFERGEDYWNVSLYRSGVKSMSDELAIASTVRDTETIVDAMVASMTREDEPQARPADVAISADCLSLVDGQDCIERDAKPMCRNCERYVKAHSQLETRLLETVADIAHLAGSMDHYSGDSRTDIAQYIAWAREFEQQFAGKPEDEYMEAVELFAKAKIEQSAHAGGMKLR